MPHLIITYAAPLKQETDIQNLVDAAFAGAEQSALFTPSAIKARAIAVDTYNTGGTSQPFVHVEIKLLPGRTGAQKKDLAERVLEKITAHVSANVAISIELNDLDRDSYTKRA